MKTKLKIYDFDGTLVRSPQRNTILETSDLGTGTAEELFNKWRAKTRKRPYSITGWFGCSETLKHPIFPRPLQPNLLNREVADQFLKDKADRSVQTMILTGRHVGLMFLVHDILLGYNLLTPDEIRCKTVISQFYENTKAPDSLTWKLNLIKQLSESYFHIEMWEDRPDHADAFEDLLESMDYLDYFEIHRV